MYFHLVLNARFLCPNLESYGWTDWFFKKIQGSLETETSYVLHSPDWVPHIEQSSSSRRASERELPYIGYMAKKPTMSQDQYLMRNPRVLQGPLKKFPSLFIPFRVGVS